VGTSGHAMAAGGAIWKEAVIRCLTLYTLCCSLLHRILETFEMSEKDEKFCSLCYKNGEPDIFFKSHYLKSPDGRVVTCPVLRKFTCTICGATEDKAHTLRYCPLNKDGVYSPGASMVELKSRKNAVGHYPALRVKPVMVCHPLPSGLRPQTEYSIASRIEQLENEVARLRAVRAPAYPGYVASRTFPDCQASERNSFTVTGGYNARGGDQAFGRSMSSLAGGSGPVCRLKVGGGMAMPHGGDNLPYMGQVFPCMGQDIADMGSRGDIAGIVARDSLGKMLAELRVGTTEVEMT